MGQNAGVEAGKAGTVPGQRPAAGYVSTEFGVTVTTVLALINGFVPQQYAPLLVTVAGVYVACRTLLKAVHALGYAKALPDLPAMPVLAGSDFRPEGTAVEGEGK